MRSFETMLISIIIPVYNVSAYIERCLQSAMRQTYREIECLIVDDATPDDSIEKCERLIEAYKGPIRFTILYHAHNQGLSAARNTGTKAATGDYILYLDSDDALTDDCIETLMAPVLRDASIEMVVGNYERLSDEYPLPAAMKSRTDLPEAELIGQETVRSYFFEGKGLYVAAWNKLIKRSFLQEHQLQFMEGVLYEDNPWTHQLMKYLGHLYIVPEVTYLHYRRPGSITTGTSQEEAGYYRGIVYEAIASQFTEGEECREARFFLNKLCSCLIQGPSTPSLNHAVTMFQEALAKGHCLKARLLLGCTSFLAKKTWGRAFFNCVLRVRRFLRGGWRG